MAKAKTLDVTFLHPRTDSRFAAEVGLDLTAQQALDELVKARFLDPPISCTFYRLHHQRTGRSIPPSWSMASAGVESGDDLVVSELHGD